MSAAVVHSIGLEALVPITVDSCTSASVRHTTSRHLHEFFGWCDSNGLGCTRTAVQQYKQHLADQGKREGTVNAALSSIRRAVREAQARGWIPDPAAQAILSVPGLPRRGQSTGRWLSENEARALIASPDSTMAGLRDSAVLSLLVGCGLRRSEATGLTVDQLQRRDSRWLISDVRGKHHRVRTVPMSSWCYAAVARWLTAAEIDGGVILRRVNKAGRVQGDSALSGTAIWMIVQRHTRPLGLEISPHDCRRTFSRLAKGNGAQTKAVQEALGHASEATTSAYIGENLYLEDPACDYVLTPEQRMDTRQHERKE